MLPVFLSPSPSLNALRKFSIFLAVVYDGTLLIFLSGQPKAQPKPATEAKAGRRNRRAARRGKASGRPKRKTAEELDAEMEDYFVTNENGAPAEGNAPVNGQAQQQPATNGGGEDLGMGDISVSAVESGAVVG